MSASRLEMDRLQELVRLHRLGTGPREVARLLGMNPNTSGANREQLIVAGVLDGSPDELPSLATLRSAVHDELGPRVTPERSSVEAHAERIEALWRNGAGPQAIYDRLPIDETA